jgi:preprotein translocase subunit SecE
MALALSENKVLTFLREARVELKKVVWPSRKQLIQHTLVVIGVSLVVAVILGAIDILLSLGLKTII